jgi:hypothetical protein
MIEARLFENKAEAMCETGDETVPVTKVRVTKRGITIPYL